MNLPVFAYGTKSGLLFELKVGFTYLWLCLFCSGYTKQFLVRVDFGEFWSCYKKNNRFSMPNEVLFFLMALYLKNVIILANTKKELAALVQVY